MTGTLLPDREIAALCAGPQPLIVPFVSRQEGKPSYGLGSFGYDIRLGARFLVPVGGAGIILDPKGTPAEAFREIAREGTLELAPGAFVLGESVERFALPADVLGLCFGKSSYARCGLLCNLTPLECFDDQTDILTLDGWKRFEDLADGEVVATLSKDGVLEYRPIIARQKRWYEGEMIAIRGRSIDLLVTPEHQLYARRQHKFDYELLRAENVEGYYELEFKRDSFWHGQAPEHFTLHPLSDEGQASTRRTAVQAFEILRSAGEMLTPDIYERLESPKVTPRTFHRLMQILANLGAVERSPVYVSEGRSTGASRFWKYRLLKRLDDFGLLEPISVPTEPWAGFLGLWLAEGSAYVARNGDYVVKVASLHTNSKARAREILAQLPFKWHESPHGFSTVSKQLCTYLMQFGHAHEKFIPPEIRRLAPYLLRKFLWGYMIGDGNLATLTASTASRALVDGLQEVALKVGWPASCWLGAAAGKPVNANPGYRSNHDQWRIRFSQQGTPRLGRSEKPWSRVLYKGYVYDVTVPPHHTIYVRRNGKAIWSGNCGWRGRLTLELANLSPLPIRLHVGQGIAQVVFFRGERPARTYEEKEAGRAYQDQQGATLPR